MEVWREMKRLASEDLFPSYRIKKLEKSKLLRKMMKMGYVPAQYASPTNEQHKKLKDFNLEYLKPVGLAFKEDEMKEFCKLWDVALNKVSSINTVISWFQARIKEIVKQGKTDVRYTTSNGSVMTLKYPKTKLKKVRTFHYGSAEYREVKIQDTELEINTRKMSSSITANITHATDAAALCAALYNWDSPFVALHDAVGMPPGKLVDIGSRRLKEGLVEATGYSVWDAFRLDNDLPLSPQSAPPIIGDLDLEDVLTSNYLFA
jgi:DNA-directed RNA polymerase